MPRRKSKAVKKSRRPKVSRRGILRKKKNRTKLSYRKSVNFSVPRLEGGNNNETEKDIKGQLGEMFKKKEKNESNIEQISKILRITYDRLTDNEDYYKQLIEEYFTEENLVTFLKDISNEKLFPLEIIIILQKNLEKNKLKVFIEESSLGDKERYFKFLIDLFNTIERRKNKAELPNLLEKLKEKYL
tara:strand:- start:295 stop:855 length:561 start_codon:yes stop_codon:yes gene_type:complete